MSHLTAAAPVRFEGEKIKGSRFIADLAPVASAAAAVERVLRACGLRPAVVDYGELVAMRIDVPVEDVGSLRSRLRDATAGRVAFESDDPVDRSAT